MTDPVSTQEQTTAAPAAATQAPAPAAAAPASGAAPEPREHSARRGGASRRRGGRGRGGAGARQGGPDSGENAAAATPSARTERAPARPVPPALEKLAEFYPHLFGAVFRPLKRGIFQDLQEAHPGVFEREELKLALGLHTRSTRYLQSVAAGEKRHDLQGAPVEDMAPEHVHHALLEVYRRRKGRGGDELLPKLRKRIVATFEASGLSREAYTELVRSRDEAANALLEEAFGEWAQRNAKDEALLRAFEASGQSVQAFADMYGTLLRNTEQTLERARRVRAANAAAAATAASASGTADTGSAEGASAAVADPEA